MKVFVSLICIIFFFTSCSNEILDGATEVRINPENIEIKANSCYIELENKESGHMMPRLEAIREADYSNDWDKINFFSCNGKEWQKVDKLFDEDNKDYYISFCTPDNQNLLIINKGKIQEKKATIFIPENTTSKKRCFYLSFFGFCEYGFVRILQHEK